MNVEMPDRPIWVGDCKHTQRQASSMWVHYWVGYVLATAKWIVLFECFFAVHKAVPNQMQGVGYKGHIDMPAVVAIEIAVAS